VPGCERGERLPTATSPTAVRGTRPLEP
jgi:hypothetical protein